MTLHSCDQKGQEKTEAVSPGTTASASAAQAPTEPTSIAPSVEIRTVVETRNIPFRTKRVEDPSLPEGSTRVRTKGVPGTKKLTYEVTFTGGVETSRRLISSKIVKRPVTKVVAVGAKQSTSLAMGTQPP